MYNNLNINYYGINANTSKQDQQMQIRRLVQSAHRRAKG